MAGYNGERCPRCGFEGYDSAKSRVPTSRYAGMGLSPSACANYFSKRAAGYNSSSGSSNKYTKMS